MTDAENRIESLRAVCPDAVYKSEGGNHYVYLPHLMVRVGDATMEMDALLRLNPEGAYLTRLYLAQQITERQTIGGRPANWTSVSIMGRHWYTWSWRDVSGELPLIQVLLDHLKALA